MAEFYQPDLSDNVDSPFVRDGSNKLVRRSYWLDMNDRTLVMVMTNGIGAHLTNDEKRAHLKDIRWPAPGSADTELGVLMEPEVDHGEAEVYARVQA
jgi:hypothetical protein